MESSKTILIFGGSGYIAGYTVNALISEFPEVTIQLIDIRQPRDEVWSNAGKKYYDQGRIVFHMGDIRERIDQDLPAADLISIFQTALIYYCLPVFSSFSEPVSLTVRQMDQLMYFIVLSTFVATVFSMYFFVNENCIDLIFIGFVSTALFLLLGSLIFIYRISYFDFCCDVNLTYNEKLILLENKMLDYRMAGS